MEKETRFINNITIRSTDEGRMIEGRAIVFNSDSRDMGFIERIMPGAITEDTIKNSDIFLTFNHNQDAVLGRSNHGQGSLAIDVNENGVDFLCEAPNTSLGNDIVELLHRGDISSCSFAFTIPEEKGAERWYRDGDTLRRDINKIDHLYDLSVVTTPAYEATKASARSLEMIRKVQDLDSQYDDMLKEIEEL